MHRESSTKEKQNSNNMDILKFENVNKNAIKSRKGGGEEVEINVNRLYSGNFIIKTPT